MPFRPHADRPSVSSDVARGIGKSSVTPSHVFTREDPNSEELTYSVIYFDEVCNQPRWTSASYFDLTNVELQRLGLEDFGLDKDNINIKDKIKLLQMMYNIKRYEFNERQFAIMLKALKAGKLIKKSTMEKDDSSVDYEDNPEWQDLLWDLGVARPILNNTIRGILEEEVRQALENKKKELLSILAMYPRLGLPIEDEKRAFAWWCTLEDGMQAMNGLERKKDKAFSDAELILCAAGIGMTIKQLETLRRCTSMLLQGIDVEDHVEVGEYVVKTTVEGGRALKRTVDDTFEEETNEKLAKRQRLSSKTESVSSQSHGHTNGKLAMQREDNHLPGPFVSPLNRVGSVASPVHTIPPETRKSDPSQFSHLGALDNHSLMEERRRISLRFADIEQEIAERSLLGWPR